MSYYIYILHSISLSKYYVGYSTDPWKRLSEHHTNERDKYTGRTKDWDLKAVFRVESKTEAISLERFIKRQKSRILIEKLIRSDFKPDGKLYRLVRVPQVRDSGGS